MKVVAVKLGNNNIYLFEYQPKYFYQDLHKGDLVKVETRIGITTGICEEDSFEIDGAALNVLVKTTGAKLPLKRVLGIYRYEALIEEEESEDNVE